VIKAVIFDYFGVICSDEYWRFVKEDKNIQGGFHELANAVNRGEVHWNEFVANVADKTGKKPTDIQRLYEAEKLNPQLLALVAKLHKTYKTGLLTNAHYEFLDPIIAKTHLDELFDVIVMSSRIGFIKPQPEIYEYILQELGVEPHEAVLVEDIERNVDGAKAVGMQTILYQNFEQMKRELESLLDKS